MRSEAFPHLNSDPRFEADRHHAEFLAMYPEPVQPTAAASIQAERVLLSFGFLSLRSLEAVAGYLKPAHFVEPLHGKVYACLLDAFNQGEKEIDVLAVADVLQDDVALPELVAISHQAEGVSSARAASLGRVIYEKAQARELFRVGQAIEALALDPARTLAERIEQARAALQDLQAPQAQGFRLLKGADLRALPPLDWLVRGVLPRQGVAGLYGPSASGKSFLGFDLAAAIAEGGRWFGCRVTAAPVVYVALEGEHGFKLRAAAWETRNERELPEQMHMVLQPFRLTEAKDVQGLAAVVPPGAVVFLDTLNRAAPTADENASKDMGEILEAVKRLQAMTGGLVCLIHHTGKAVERGLRGHSSLFAALDAAIEVSRDGDRREWKVAKSKDGEDGQARAFRLAVVEVAHDQDGEPITSCVVEPDLSAEEVARVKLPQGGNQKLALDLLREQFKAKGRTGIEGAPPLRLCLEVEAAVSAVAASLPVPKDRKTERARTAVTGLIARGVLVSRGGWIWQS